MDTQQALLAGLVTLAILLAVAMLAIRMLVRRLQATRQALTQKDSDKRSQSTRYGQITEQFAPFLATWPWDAKRFKFVGDPIDGIQFNDDGIVFVEIKTAKSRLSAVQRQVRDHIAAGRVAWQEIRIA